MKRGGRESYRDSGRAIVLTGFRQLCTYTTWKSISARLVKGVYICTRGFGGAGSRIFLARSQISSAGQIDRGSDDIFSLSDALPSPLLGAWIFSPFGDMFTLLEIQFFRIARVPATIFHSVLKDV